MKPESNWRHTAWATTVLVLVLALAAFVIALARRSAVYEITSADVVFLFAATPFVLVGWVLAVRRPRIPQGWIFLLFPLILLLGVISEVFAFDTAFAGPDSVAAALSILGDVLQFLAFLLVIGPAMLLFPNGRLPSDQYRRLLPMFGALILVWVVILTIGSSTVCVDRFGEAAGVCDLSVENPLGVLHGDLLAKAAHPLSIAIFMLVFGASVAAVITRYRSSTDDVRQQIKWVTWTVALGLISAILTTIVQDWLGIIRSPWVDIIGFSLIFAGIPVAIGLSILRYRLYDIDRLISRTATYAVIVAVLVGVYVASVTLIQQLLPVRGQLGIVVSTLLVIALFSPLRRWVQNVVDRRFYRARYDAQRVLDEFSRGIREDVDLEQTQGALMQAAEQTMQPAHLSLWLREPSQKR